MAKEKIHILGICGTFMGGLAILGNEAGLEISAVSYTHLRAHET